MKTLEVHVDLGPRSYPIFIGSGLIDLVGKYCRSHTKGGRCMLVGDSHTMPLFGSRCAASLKKASYAFSQWKFRAGEASKDLKTLSRLYDALAKEGMERSSFLAALGGGVVGDMAGFAAATYMRGIAFVQVPTTLLAQVDSSVGGKTAVNLAAGKNLVGAFYQPKCVLCDVDALKTLPARQLRCGLSEVIKYGIILDADFFVRLEKQVDPIMACESKVMAQIVQRCCELKALVTGEDERESGRRAILNFGHTLAHSIEKEYGYGKLTHGEAVAVGQLIACRLSEALLGFPRNETERVFDLFHRVKLPTFVSAPDPVKMIARLIETTHHDKKAQGGEPLFVLAERIGECRFGCKVPESLLRTVLKEFVKQGRK